MKKAYQLTQAGKQELEKELEELKSLRVDLAQKVAEARDFGDLSENAEYDAARTEQGRVETRIVEIEDILKNATTIRSGKTSKVVLGSTVELKTDGKKVTYTVVGSVEADPLEGKISDVSPIGEALLDKKVGEKVEIETPRGNMSYEVVSIS
ncbi:MAG TPA: transcription elongation factor GreA [Patescibacteria group bacterium]|jgi:transcription elongation factor GreA|nr:transcription elongation factor GreA [Patescibacteria group bacterium]